MANAHKPQFACQLQVLSPSENSFLLELGSHEIGASSSADVTIKASGVSRRHVRITVCEMGIIIQDLNSRNGTRVNGRKIGQAACNLAVTVQLGSAILAIAPADAGAHAVALPATNLSVDTASGADTEGGDTLGMALWPALTDLAAHCRDGYPGLSELLELWRSRLNADALALLADDVVLESAGNVAMEPDATFPSGDRTLAVWGSADGFEVLAPLLIRVSGTASSTSHRQPDGHLASDEVRSRTKITSLTPSVIKAFDHAAKVARGEIPVLITGETGVGKDVLANRIHDWSQRAGKPLVVLNCAAIPKDLLEAELFGIDSGTATGVTGRAGLIEQANGGTLFLDELAEMPLDLQAKVLRLLGGHSVFRVGGRTEVSADVRMVAATNADLQERVESGQFRLDLYHRLAAFEVELPPLRERRLDLCDLAQTLYAEALAGRGLASPGITSGALACLYRYAWPGNIRELKNVMERAVLLMDPGQPLDSAHLPERIRSSGLPFERPLHVAIEQAERDALIEARSLFGGDWPKICDFLEISKSQYYRKVKDYALAPQQEEDRDCR